MSWHDFIFSNQGKYRIQRYLICWLLWWLYVVLTVFYTAKMPNAFFHYQPGLEELGFRSYFLLVIVKSFILLLTHIFFCYASIYFIFSDFLLRKKTWHLVSWLLILSTLMIPIGYYLYTMVYPHLDQMFGLHIPKSNSIVWASIDACLMYAIKVSLIAIAITLLKQWWVRHQEKEQLEKQRINAEVQLLKAQIQPAFLFSTLENITTEARLASPKAPEMLIKLSDLLSYMLYECDVPRVKLEREIAMLREYITLEKIRQGEQLELTFQVNGKFTSQLISPLLLLPFIDNIFSYGHPESSEQVWVNLDITIGDNSLSMKIIHGIPMGIDKDSVINSESMVKIQKRLDLLYEGKYDLKMNAEQELLLIHLNLKLEEPSQTEPSFNAPTTAKLNYA